jgi:hypothetical protein
MNSSQREELTVVSVEKVIPQRFPCDILVWGRWPTATWYHQDVLRWLVCNRP